MRHAVLVTVSDCKFPLRFCEPSICSLGSYFSSINPPTSLLILFSNLMMMIIFLNFSGLHLQHTDVPILGAESELQLPAYTTATATQDPSHSCDLHHSSRQYLILNPLSEARDRTHIFMDASRVP